MLKQWSCALWFSALFVSGLGEIHWDCLEPNIIKCEATNFQNFQEATDGLYNYTKMCESIRELIDCAQIDCGGDPWDPTDDFLTKLQVYLEKTGLCGGVAQTNSCAEKLSKKCIRQMAQDMVEGKNPCMYYGTYASCIIKFGGKCQDAVTTAYMEEMRRQIREKMPTVFGDTTVDMCPDWPEQFQMCLNEQE